MDGPGSVGKRLAKLAELVAWLATALLLFYAALVIHDFFQYVDVYPYLSVDDILGNASYLLAKQGRFAFLASPVLQVPGYSTLRLEGLITYGPWYFYLGGLLCWLFGFSLTLMRSIHLLVILAICVLAFWRFSGSLRVAAVLFSWLLLTSFDQVQWPMIRPDSMVSLCAVGLFVSGGLALGRGKPGWWLLVGIAASWGAFTHLVAWSLVVVALFLFAVWLWAGQEQPGGWRRLANNWREALALLAGLASGAFLYYWSFGFRLADNLGILTGYSDLTQGRAGTGLLNRVMRLWASASLSHGVWPWLLVGLGVGVTVLAILLVWRRRRGPEFLSDAALWLPPVAVAISYTLSLAAYPNMCAGYLILIYVSYFWSLSAIVAVLLRRLTSWQTWWGESAKLLLAGALIVLLAQGTVFKLQGRSLRANLAEQWTPISQYLAETISALPKEARAFGTVCFGLENPGRIQLLQLSDGLRLLEKVPLGCRSDLLPDYIIWGYVENRDYFLIVQRDVRDESFLQRLGLRHQQFVPIRLVLAPPYGVTRTYLRVPPGQTPPPGEPTVSAYNPPLRQWGRRLSPPLKVAFQPCRPLLFQVGYRPGGPARYATRTWSAPLEPGVYFLKVRLRPLRTPTLENLALVASSPGQARSLISETGPRFDVCPYRPNDTVVYLLHRHLGGRLFLSQFDSRPGAGIEEVVVRRVVFWPQGDQVPGQPLPPLEQWRPAQGVKILRATAQELEVQGDASSQGYQLVSPPIEVEPYCQVVISVPITVKAGRLAVGVLDQTRNKWIVPPYRLKRELRFASRGNRRVFLVITNNHAPSARTRSHFVLKPGRLWVEREGESYTDLLVERAKQPCPSPPKK